jgi:4a-hydroxytetrahydrobiopterin dehydratase
MPRPAALSPEDIRASLATLPEWDVVERTPSGSDHLHAELHRLFQFQSFADAMHFMLTASRFIHVTDHHPSWQNTYSKVEVWITTGELKHKLSAKDFKLAEYLQSLFESYSVPNS